MFYLEGDTIEEVEVELFFNAGDIGKQVNWLIYPQSLNACDREEMLDISDSQSDAFFSKEGYKKFKRIEDELKKRKAYPDPTKLKDFSKWYYGQLEKGAVVYRYGLDGRRETTTGRVNSSIEGAFFPGIDIDKTVEKYSRKGIDIISEIGSQLPENMEKFLVAQNFDVFRELYRQYESEDKLSSLYNHFYAACVGKEIAVQKNISVRPLCKIGPFGKIFK